MTEYSDKTVGKKIRPFYWVNLTCMDIKDKVQFYRISDQFNF